MCPNNDFSNGEFEEEKEYFTEFEKFFNEDDKSLAKTKNFLDELYENGSKIEPKSLREFYRFCKKTLSSNKSKIKFLNDGKNKEKGDYSKRLQESSKLYNLRKILKGYSEKYRNKITTSLKPIEAIKMALESSIQPRTSGYFGHFA